MSHAKIFVANHQMNRVANCVKMTYNGTAYDTTGTWTGATMMSYKGHAVTKQADGGISINLGVGGPDSGAAILLNQVDPYDFSNCTAKWGSALDL